MAKRYRVTLTDEERERLERPDAEGHGVGADGAAGADAAAGRRGADRRGRSRRRSASGVATVERTAAAVRRGGAGGVARGSGRARARARSWVRSSRRSWSRWPARSRRRGGAAGRCSCWPTAWSSWRWSRTSPMRRSGGCSKEQAQAVAEEGVGDPDRRRRVRLADGGRARPVRRAATTRPARSSASTRPASNWSPRPGSRCRWQPGKPERVDYEYERNGTANLFLVTQPLGGLAPRRGHRPAHQARLRPPDARPGRSPLPGRRRRSASCSTT